MPSDDEVLAGLEFVALQPTVLDLAELTPPQRTSRFLVDQVIDGAVVDVTNLADHELSAFRNWVRQALLGSAQMHVPAGERTDAGDALHSVWIACHIEWQRRRPD